MNRPFINVIFYIVDFSILFYVLEALCLSIFNNQNLSMYSWPLNEDKINTKPYQKRFLMYYISKIGNTDVGQIYYDYERRCGSKCIKILKRRKINFIKIIFLGFDALIFLCEIFAYNKIRNFLALFFTNYFEKENKVGSVKEFFLLVHNYLWNYVANMKREIVIYFQTMFKKFNRIFFLLVSIKVFSSFAMINIIRCNYKTTNDKLYFQIHKRYFLLMSTYIFLFKAFCSDAGSIPVKRNFIITMEKKDLNNYMNFKEIKLNNHTIQLKFCRTCMVWRPPRTSHCSFCGGCKLKFDHHCPWIGKCVALKNYRYFLFFILYLFWFLLSNLNIVLHDQSRHTEEWVNLLKIFLKITGFFASIFTFALIGFHIYLGFIGKTTAEFLKFPDKSIRSWNFKKELANKFYKKNHSTLLKIRFSEKKKFCLVEIDLKTELEKKNEFKLIIKTTLNSSKKRWKNFCWKMLFISFFSYCYVKYSRDQEERNKNLDKAL